MSKHSAWDGVPRDTLEKRLLAFFDMNPDEELAPSDAVVKFGRRLESTAYIMREMAERGLLNKRRDGRFIIYTRAA